MGVARPNLTSQSKRPDRQTGRKDMSFISNPTHYTRDELSAMLSRVRVINWQPKFPTLHNTGVPSLAQWRAFGPTPQERWGANLNSYYSGLGWHAGPHFVCCPD